MSQLEVSGVHKRFGGQPVLVGVDLAVGDDSLTAILGPSGSGKTTLLRLIAGFDRIDRGEIRIADETVDDGRRHQPPERRRLGYVPQEGALFPHLTVAGNVGFGVSRAERRGDRIGELLEMVGLTGMARRYPHQLSGGQQQRVALARALAVDPDLVLLDEPFSSLDATLRTSLRAEVRDILRAAGATTILVTHDQDEALSLADRVAVLRAGEIVQHAPPHDLYTRPVDPDLARFLGEANLLDATIDGPRADTPLGPVELIGAVTGATSGTVLLRPEQIELTVAGRDGRPVGAAGATGHVVGSGFHGHYTIVRVRLDGPADSEILVRHEDLVPPDAGTGVELSVRGAAMAWPHGVGDGEGQEPT
jgi:iron(III) transport system ATP-binding protein